MSQINNIKEVTEPLKEEILKGDVHTIEEMKAWLKPLGYSDAINDAAINFILREFVMSKISSDSMMNMDMVVKLLRPQLEVTKEYNNTSKHLSSNIRHLTGAGSHQGLS